MKFTRSGAGKAGSRWKSSGRYAVVMTPPGTRWLVHRWGALRGILKVFRWVSALWPARKLEVKAWDSDSVPR